MEKKVALHLKNISDRKLFGNDAGEDDDLDVLNSYYIDNDGFSDFFDPNEKLSIVSARKGMGKSALLARMHYKLLHEQIYKAPLIIRVKGGELLGLGDFSGSNHAYLENYWKQIICKRIVIEIGNQIGFALSSNEITMVEQSEIDGLKSKNLIGGLIARLINKIPIIGSDIKTSAPENLKNLLQNYSSGKETSGVWMLIDDIDSKFENNAENRAKVGAFFSAIRYLAFELKNINIRATVRSDVWACLRHLEDLDKLQQYILPIFWTKAHMQNMLAQKILLYIKSHHEYEREANYSVNRDYNKILDVVFDSPIEWRGNKNARLFDAVYSFSNKRPRWMIQLCRMAGKKVSEIPNAKRISLERINYILSDYGSNRRDDLIKEHSHQFEELSNLIDSLRASQKEFKYSELDSILNDNFIRGRSSDQIGKVDGKIYTTTEDLGDFLYKIGLISRVHDDHIKFTHFNNDPDLFRSQENRKDNLVWSIHPAYRSFLNIRS